MAQDSKKEEQQKKESNRLPEKEKREKQSIKVPNVEESITEESAAMPDGKDKEIEKLKLKAEEYLFGWKRAQADYQNLTKETERRISEICKYATEEFIYELLPLVDHFKFAFKAIPEKEQTSQWLQGIKHIQDNFLKILEQHGVMVIPASGQKFDPQLHEAVSEVEGKNEQSGLIAEEVASGFIFNGKIIRVAKVKIYK